MSENLDYNDFAKQFAEQHQQFNNQKIEENSLETQCVNNDNSENIPNEIKAKAFLDIVTDPTKAIRANVSSKIQQKIQTDDNVQQRLDKTASSVIDSSLTKEENKATAEKISSENDVNEANFQKYKNEYSHFGILSTVDKPWKTKIITLSNDFWFIIWAFISFFTIVPISIFMERLRALKGFVKVVFIIIGVLLCMGVVFALIVLILHFANIDLIAMIKN